MKKNKMFFGFAGVLMISTIIALALVSCPGTTIDPGNLLTVTYHANGESVTVPKAQKAVPGATVYVAALPGYDPATAEKYFNGWNTESDGSGNLCTPGAALVVDENIDLWAEWTGGGGGNLSGTGGYTVVMEDPGFFIPWYGIAIPELIDIDRIEAGVEYAISYSLTSNVALPNLQCALGDASGIIPPTGDLKDWVEVYGYPNIRDLSTQMSIGTNIPANMVVSGLLVNLSFISPTSGTAPSFSELANCILFYVLGTAPEQPTLTITELTVEKTEMVKVTGYDKNGDTHGTPTSQIYVTFDKPVYNLSPEDFTVKYMGYYTSTIKINSVTGSGTSYTLGITTPPSDSSETMDITVVLDRREGIKRISGVMDITLYTGYLEPPPPPEPLSSAYFQYVVANGNLNTTTTQLTIYVSRPMSETSLTSANISLSGMNVTKGALSGGVIYEPLYVGYAYYLPISGFTTGGTISVSIAKDGWNIIHNNPSNYTRTIYYGYENVVYDGFIGKGYDVLNNSYYTSNQVTTAYALNMKKLIGEGKYVKNTYNYRTTDSDYIVGESLVEYAKAYAADAKLSANAGFFSASVSLGASGNNSFEATDSFASSRIELVKEKQNLLVSLADLRELYLDETFRNDWLFNPDATAADIFLNYGTHIFITAYLGGRLDADFIYHNEQHDDYSEIHGKITASTLYVKGEASYSQEQQAKTFLSNSNQRVHTEGGTVGSGMSTFASAMENYPAWAASIENTANMSLVRGGDLNKITEMIPIWELVDPNHPYAYIYRDRLINEYQLQLERNGGVIMGMQKDAQYTYVGDVYLGRGSSQDLAVSSLRAESTSTMIVISENLNPDSVGQGDYLSSYYIAMGYTTTTNANNAVRDIIAIYNYSAINVPPDIKIINGKTYTKFGETNGPYYSGGYWRHVYLFKSVVAAAGDPIKNLYVEVDGDLSGMTGSGWERVKTTDGEYTNLNYRGLPDKPQLYLWMQR